MTNIEKNIAALELEIDQLDMSEPTAELELDILMSQLEHQEYLLGNPTLK